MSNIYQNDVGIIIELDTKLPVATLATATGQTIEVLQPDATETIWSATILLNTSKIRHTITSNELNQIGTYKLQAKITFNGGSVVRGDTATMKVLPNFQ